VVFDGTTFATLCDFYAYEESFRGGVTVAAGDVGGDGRDDAVDELHSLGLETKVKEKHGILDELLPGGWGVCDTSPGAGARLARGSRVELTVSKTC
jgi:beta-lactam-binding protein with PASTA domain